MSALVSTLFLGAVVGGIYALDAFGLVLTYRTSGVFNFAQGALGMFFAYVYFQLVQGGQLKLVVGHYDQRWHLPAVVALLLVVGVLAPAFGWLLHAALFRQLRAAGTVVQIVATIGLLIALFGLAGVVWGSATTLTPHSLFPRHRWTVGGVHATLPEVATILIVLALCAALLAFLRYSPLGIRMRAVVDRAEVSELMGVNSNRVAGVSWAVATGFAALAGILIAPFYGSLDTVTLTFLVIAATAAAVVGVLQSLPLALAGGIGIGMAQFLVQQHTSSQVARVLQPSIPFIVLFLFLLLPIRWPTGAATSAPRVRPMETVTRSPRQRLARVAILAAVLVVPTYAFTGTMSKILGGAWQKQLALVPGMALIFLSLVVLAGYAGQISLCQGALAGFAAFVSAHLVADHHMSFFLAALLAALLTVPIGAMLASRATALPPLFLGLATLAFGAVMDQVAFTTHSFSNGLIGVVIARPHLVRSDRAYYFMGLAVFGVCALLVSNLRRGKTGLALAAMRDSQTGITSVGSSVARLKLVSFCLSAFLAGLGGAVFAGARGRAITTDYLTQLSLIFLALAVIGGISRWPGALLGAALFQLVFPIVNQPFFLQNVVFKNVFHGQLSALLYVTFGLGGIGLAQNPHGLVEQIRDGVAQARERFGRRAGPPSELAVATAGAARRERGHGPPVVADHARLYHRPGCVLTVGKETRPLSPARARRLERCPVCDPPAPPPLRARTARRARPLTASD